MSGYGSKQSVVIRYLGIPKTLGSLTLGLSSLISEVTALIGIWWHLWSVRVWLRMLGSWFRLCASMLGSLCLLFIPSALSSTRLQSWSYHPSDRGCALALLSSVFEVSEERSHMLWHDIRSLLSPLPVLSPMSWPLLRVCMFPSRWLTVINSLHK